MNNSILIMNQVNDTLRFHSSNLVSQEQYSMFLELSEFKRNLERIFICNSCKKDNRIT